MEGRSTDACYRTARRLIDTRFHSRMRTLIGRAPATTEIRIQNSPRAPLAPGNVAKHTEVVNPLPEGTDRRNLGIRATG